ncbi:MAG: type I restriction endonuclease subunit R, partial [Alphaproteobacteria bacterium]
LDFRQQQAAVEEAIALFSGEKIDHAREIWLVDPAPKVISSLQAAVQSLGDFMRSQGLSDAPEDVPNLRGDAARSQFIILFKEVQRLKTQLDQYTDLSEEQANQIRETAPPDALQGFRSMYLETAKRLKEKQNKPGTREAGVEQLDFEFVLFASAVVDYDYIMGLIARYTQNLPGRLNISREQLIGLIQSDAKFIDERQDIGEYIRGLDAGQPLDEGEIRVGYERFKAEKLTKDLTSIADRYGVEPAGLQAFVDMVLRRRIFDGEALSDLMAPLALGWKARTQRELALVEDLAPVLHRLAQGREISGLSAYEQ